MQLSALGIAIAPMVTVAEILKNRGLAVEKKISTALESLSDNYRCAPAAPADPSLHSTTCVASTPCRTGHDAHPRTLTGAHLLLRAGRARSPTWKSCS